MYSTNDWRYYLAHGWGTSPEQKEKERAYNTEYYQTHKYKWYGETKPDGSVSGYFDVNPGGEYEFDEDYKPVNTKKKKKKTSSSGDVTGLFYVNGENGSSKKKKTSSSGDVTGLFYVNDEDDSDPVTTYTKYISKSNKSRKKSSSRKS